MEPEGLLGLPCLFLLCRNTCQKGREEGKEEWRIQRVESSRQNVLERKLESTNTRNNISIHFVKPTVHEHPLSWHPHSWCDKGCGQFDGLCGQPVTVAYWESSMGLVQ